MSEDKTTTQAQAESTHPEDNGESSKTFTQEDVNKIVSDRLARERAKAEPTQEDIREKDLTARENKITCREFLTENKYPEAFLDLFGTDNAEVFKDRVEKLIKAFPDIVADKEKTPMIIRGGTSGKSTLAGHDAVAEAFKPKI